jgi:hypothetical protein
MYKDHTPQDYGLHKYEDFWTIALMGRSGNGKADPEVHFGVFTMEDAREAMDSGKVKTRDDEWLELRRIRQFPK